MTSIDQLEEISSSTMTASYMFNKKDHMLTPQPQNLQYAPPTLPCPTGCGCLLKTNGAKAAPNIYSVSAALHLYLLPAYNNAEDNCTPRATSWGIC